MKRLAVAVFGLMVGCVNATPIYTKDNIRNALKPVNQSAVQLDGKWIYLTSSKSYEIYLLEKSWETGVFPNETRKVNGWLLAKTNDSQTIEDKTYQRTEEHWNINCSNRTFYIDLINYFNEDENVYREEHPRPRSLSDYTDNNAFKFRYPSPHSIEYKLITETCGLNYTLDEIFKDM